MKDLRFLFKDKDFLAKAEEFTKTYFIGQNRKLLDKVWNNQKIKSSDFDSKWTDLKLVFWEKQNKRCALCEKELNDEYVMDIEHFRPKNEYWWLAYNYQNYYLACAECNRKYKNVKFPLFDENKKVAYSDRKNIQQEEPLLMNPTIDNPEEYFELVFKTDTNLDKEAGIAILKPLKSLDKNSLKAQKAQKTIEIFNLDLNEWFETRYELFKKFYQDLIGLAENRRKDKATFKNYYEQFKNDKPEIAQLGLTKLILRGQFEIAGFLD